MASSALLSPYQPLMAQYRKSAPTPNKLQEKVRRTGFGFVTLIALLQLIQSIRQLLTAEKNDQSIAMVQKIMNRKRGLASNCLHLD